MADRCGGGSLATDDGTGQTGQARQGVELIRHITDEIINNGDLTLARKVCSGAYVARKPGLSLPRGPEALKMVVRQWRDAFPDYHVTIEDLFGAGEMVTCRYVAEGTHRGALLGVPPTERAFRITGVEVHRVVDGYLTESWLADDVPRMWTELGVLAPTTTRSNQWT